MLALILVACSNDDDSQGQCLEEPCGTINPSAKNLTVFTELEGLESVTLQFENDSQNLELDGLDVSNQKFSSCWQEVEFMDIESVQITLNGETSTITTFENDTNSNVVSLNVLKIENNIVITFQDYTECEDVIDNSSL